MQNYAKQVMLILTYGELCNVINKLLENISFHSH